MKDDYTKEQLQRMEDQDEFLGAVKGAVEGGKQYRGIKVGKKVKTKFTPGFKDLNAEGKAREKNVNVDELEKVYQQNKKDINDENVTDMTNPKYQSPKSQQKKNPVDDAVKTGGIKVRKVLGN